ncbi:MAG TPA: tetratricopeptide repeat protein, partial [Nitrospiraceae bacterium]|nr:tetratricopeptide repeat protein [Nitrospiraceae bacterium]
VKLTEKGLKLVDEVASEIADGTSIAPEMSALSRKEILNAVDFSFRAFAEDGRTDEALVALDRAAELAPDDAAVHAAQGSVLIDAGREDAGIAAYERAIGLGPTASAELNEKALALSRAGRFDDAVRILRRMMPLLGKDVETLNNLAWILANASIDPAQGLEFARRARELAPDDAVILDTFGWAAVRAGRAGEAVEPLEQALKATDDPEVRGHLAAALHALGRVDDARAHARAALAARPALANVPEIARAAR